jgi:polyisoprenoid-binding protein YceI
MNRKRITGLILSLLLMALMINTNAQTNFRLMPEKSKLQITGTSSLHDWEMDVSEFDCNVTAQSTPGNIAISQIEFTCPVDKITSNNRIMDNKTYSALKEKEHPVISFRSNDISVINADNGKVEIAGMMTIAGVAREIKFSAEVNIQGNSSITADGIVTVNMKDFNIDPPTAMLGTLKTGEEVKVKYSFEFISRENEITRNN